MNIVIVNHMEIIDKVNDLAFEGLYPGPAAFLHRFMWDKIYATHVAHSNKGLFGAHMATAPNMIINEIHGMLEETK
jgi:hypothetical protein